MSDSNIILLKHLLKSLEDVVHERQKLARSDKAQEKYNEDELEEIRFVTMVLAAFKPVLSKTIKRMEE